MKIKSVGSVCSGIEAASVAWPFYEFKWFSEIAKFQSDFLAEKYSEIPNLGDMTSIPEKLLNKEVYAPDLICGGTPCQAFSLAGLKKGLNDDRGNLTLKFIEIVNSNDKVRLEQNKNRSIVFWENVEGVLKDKTNAFGCFIASLAGLEEEIPLRNWKNAGLLRGPVRNVAWRVLDAKYFGIPQQRKRIYVIAGGKDFNPENVLFEKHLGEFKEFPKYPLTFRKGKQSFEVFREYTDCLYSSYGTKWNGNAAALNGSLFVVEDNRLRRFTPLECERLMGFPDNYTDISRASPTNRFQGTGNSWAVPVIKWFGERFKNYPNDSIKIDNNNTFGSFEIIENNSELYLFDTNTDNYSLFENTNLNFSEQPENCVFGTLKDIIQNNADEKFFISPTGCAGILRRSIERNSKLNPRLKEVLQSISSQLSKEEIDKISRIQPRGNYSIEYEKKNTKVLIGS